VFRRRSALILVAPLALLATGCGGGGGTPGIASVASSTPATTPTQTNPTSPPKGLGDAPGARFRIAMNVGNAALGAKFSSCMRKHGVTNFPDPNSQGVIQFGSGTGIDPQSPTFQSARSTCQKLLPNGGQPTPQQQAQMQRQMLALSKCMRAHGIKDFPDPSNDGIRLNGGPGSDLDPNNAQFQAAQRACQDKLPFKGLGTKGTTASAGK
jgi:hypothetical protein